MRPFWLTLAISIVSVCCLSSSDAASVEIKTADVADGVRGWAIAPESDRYFAAIAKDTTAQGGLIYEYDRTGKKVREFVVSRRPLELTIKKGHLIVACGERQKLHFIDLRENKVVGELEFGDSAPTGLCCSDVDNTFIYCCTYAVSGTTLYQIDIATRKVRHQLSLGGFVREPVFDGEMSVDGNWLALQLGQVDARSGTAVMQIDEPTGQLHARSRLSQNLGKVSAGPLSRSWSFGPKFYSIDLKTPIRECVGDVSQVHRSLDLVAGVNGQSLVLQRFSDLSTIATVALPMPEPSLIPGKPTRSRSRRDFRTHKIGFDRQQDVVFVGTHSQGHWCDLSGLSNQLNPRHAIIVPWEFEFELGEPIAIDLKLTNDEPKNGFKLVRLAGPDGIRIQNRKLTWKTQPVDVGINEVRIGLQSADGSHQVDEAVVTVHVKPPTIDVGFQIQATKFSADYRQAVLWGYLGEPKRIGQRREGPKQLAVIDLVNKKVLARQSVPAGIHGAAIDKDYVYVAPMSGQVLYRFGHTLNNAKRAFLSHPHSPVVITPVAPDRLVIDAGQQEVFNRRTLDPAPPRKVVPSLPLPKIHLATGGHTMVDDGRRMDRNSGKLLRIHASGYLPPVIETPNRNSTRLVGLTTTIPPETVWGHSANGNSLYNHRFERVELMPSVQAVAISQRWPIAVAIGKQSSREFREEILNLEIRSLVDGHVLFEKQMDRIDQLQSGRLPFGGNPTNVFCFADTIYLQNEGKLSCLPMPQTLVDTVVEPACFSQEQPTEIKVAETESIKLNVSGNTAGVSFTPLLEIPHVDFNRATSEMTVDTVALWKHFCEKSAVATTKISRFQPPGFPRRSTIPPILYEPNQNRTQYKRLTGTEMAKDLLAAFLPVHVMLEDGNGRRDSTQFSIVVVGPREVYDKAVGEKNDAVEAEDTKRLLAQESAQKLRMAAPGSSRPAPPRPSGAAFGSAPPASEQGNPSRSDATEDAPSSSLTPNQRLDQLDAKVRRMEAVLDSILQKLDAIAEKKEAVK